MRTSSAGFRGVAADGIRMDCISKQLAPALEIHEEKWIARDGKPPRSRSRCRNVRLLEWNLVVGGCWELMGEVRMQMTSLVRRWTFVGFEVSESAVVGRVSGSGCWCGR